MDASNTNDAIITYGPPKPRDDNDDDYQQWNLHKSLYDRDSSYKTPKEDLDEKGFGLNVTSGIFKPPKPGFYVVTITAVLKTSGFTTSTSNEYAQV